MCKWWCLLAVVVLPALGAAAPLAAPGSVSLLLYPLCAPADLPPAWAALTQDLLLDALRACPAPRVKASLFDPNSPSARRLVQDWPFLDQEALRAGTPAFVYMLGEEMKLDAVLICRLEHDHDQRLLLSARLLSVRSREVATYLAGINLKRKSPRAMQEAVRAVLPRLLRDLAGELQAAMQAPAATSAECLQRARELRSARQLYAAIREYVRALARDRQLLPACVEQAECYLEVGDLRGARLLARRALTLGENELSVQRLWARLELTGGKADQAELRYRRQLALHPDDLSLRAGLAQALLAQGKPDEAADLLETLLVARPGDDALLTQVAELCRQLGRLLAAAGHYRALLARDPRNVAARDRLIEVYLQQEDLPAAVREYQAAFEVASQPVTYTEDGYRRLAALFDREAQTLLDQSKRLLENGETSAQMSDLYQRSSTLVATVQHVLPPAALRAGHDSRVFAYSLLSECNFALSRYLQGGDRRHYDRAVMLREAAATTLRKAMESPVAGAH